MGVMGFVAGLRCRISLSGFIYGGIAYGKK